MGRCVWFKMALSKPAEECADNQAALCHPAQNTQIWVFKAHGGLAGVFLQDTNTMTALKGSQHWDGSPRGGEEPVFLMTCENRVVTYVWAGFGEACLVSW